MNDPIKLTKQYFSPIAKAWIWLRTTLILLGLLLVATGGYCYKYGLPQWLRDADAKLTSAKLESLRTEFDQAQSGVTELLNWRENFVQMQARKAEAEKIKLAKR